MNNANVRDISKTKKTGGLSLYSTDQTSGISRLDDAGRVTYVPTKKTSGETSNPTGGNPTDAGGDGGNDATNIYLDEIQKAASEKNYKTLLQSDIAAYNLKMNTQKYLNNNLAASGLNTQGYGTSAHTGVENTAQNLYAQNLATYNEAEQTAQTAAEERADTKSTENDNQLVTYLQYSDGSDEQIANYMANYGYTKDEDGVWKDADGNKASAYILSAIESAKNNHAATGSEFAASVTSGKSGADASILSKWDDKTLMKNTFGDNYEKYSNEIKYMFNNPEFQEQVTDGLTVHLVNGQDDSYGAYFIYYNGSWYKTDASTFSQASNKQTIKGK